MWQNFPLLMLILHLCLYSPAQYYHNSLTTYYVQPQLHLTLEKQKWIQAFCTGSPEKKSLKWDITMKKLHLTKVCSSHGSNNLSSKDWQNAAASQGPESLVRWAGCRAGVTQAVALSHCSWGRYTGHWRGQPGVQRAQAKLSNQAGTNHARKSLHGPPEPTAQQKSKGV